jgi:hypothetical protein
MIDEYKQIRNMDDLAVEIGKLHQRNEQFKRELNEAKALLGMIYRDRDYGGFTTTSKSGLSDDDFEKLRREFLQKGTE